MVNFSRLGTAMGFCFGIPLGIVFGGTLLLLGHRWWALPAAVIATPVCGALAGRALDSLE